MKKKKIRTFYLTTFGGPAWKIGYPLIDSFGRTFKITKHGPGQFDWEMQPTSGHNKAPCGELRPDLDA